MIVKFLHEDDADDKIKTGINKIQIDVERYKFVLKSKDKEEVIDIEDEYNENDLISIEIEQE